MRDFIASYRQVSAELDALDGAGSARKDAAGTIAVLVSMALMMPLVAAAVGGAS